MRRPSSPKTVVLSLLALAPLLAPSGARAFSNHRIPIPTAWARCAADADCALAGLDCCGCFAGGVSIAINEVYRDRYERRFAKACADFLSGGPDQLFCPAVNVCPPGAEVFCNARQRCEFGVR